MCFSTRNSFPGTGHGFHITGSDSTVVRCTASDNGGADFQDDGFSTRLGTLRTSPVGAGPWDNFDY